MQSVKKAKYDEVVDVFKAKLVMQPIVLMRPSSVIVLLLNI